MPLAAALFVGCNGIIGDGDGEAKTPGIGDPDNPLVFACDPALDPTITPLRRLTLQQYRSTLESLAERRLGAAEAATLMASLETKLAIIPVDSHSSTQDYIQMDQNVSQAHVDGYYAVAHDFADWVTSPATAGAFVGDCAVDGDDTNDAACVDDFIRSFGLQAMRRPLTDDEVTFFRDEIYDVSGPIDLRGFADIVTGMLMSPPFTFRIENANPAVDGKDDVYPLSGFELASRLSFHFWQSTPDDALLEAAASGKLDTDEGFAEELDRVFADPRTQAAVDGFYEQWLELERVPDMTEAVDRPSYIAFAGADLPGPDFRDHLIQDAKNLLRYYTWFAGDGFAGEGSFDDLFLSDRAFADSDDVARLYGADTPVYREGEEPAALQGRAGLLMRPALLANNKTTTRPILKGALIRKRILCDDVTLPNDIAMDVMNAQTELDQVEAKTTRERVERITEQAPACAACHVGLINPLGFATENFDGLGRFRTEEVVYDTDGSEIARLPIDTSTVPRIIATDDRAVSDGVEMSELVVESGKAHACFARHYFRFAFGRKADFERDGCVLESLRQGIIDAGSLRAMLRSIALEPHFRLRKRGEG
ncbi:MAG: DUF1592 domain-containing protein [Polyangiaceae bacterium]